ncbi:CoA transferase [Brevibacillus sp. SYP-B805]|uniref:CaiB/BaiF CoA transferase family protein n=1 Tax=Brevibacillus sp. SYP-B805 TaxID=1578199 RepID=UPI0013E9F920|nr:CaiB/BaiF CoA-transferase family protein [Brevibacillus sp. SYP-B805]NGQ93595.1 CoA transferase [Brevibacillus sp. SYP-B805]
MLHGIRVVDFTRYLPGPFATLRLADMGAEVIKVEPPHTGDPARLMGDQLQGAGLVYLANNRSKKSVTINLKEAEGRELAFQLAAQADVVIEGFRPGVADAMGIGYDRLKEVRPDLVYCSLTGYGQTGPLRSLGGHDLNYMALSGVLSQLRDQSGRPIQPGIQFADMIGGIAASEAILAALVKKERTGEGSYLDISMTDAMIGIMTGHVMIQQVTGQERGVPQLGGSLISYYLYETRDGRFVSLAALEKKFWENFCKAVGREDWIGDHLSPTHEENGTFAEIRALFKSRTFAEWSEFSRKVDCCMAPVLDPGEMVNDPYVREKGLVSDIESREWGRLCQVATSAGGFGAQRRQEEVTPPPALGQHNLDVFQTVLNVSPKQLEEWAERGII